MIKSEDLKHKLKNRHIQMIALGGAIGTGFFLDSTDTILKTGSSIILAYILGGAMIYVIMRALGEMTVAIPTSGSYVEYSKFYLGDICGFITGWNSWLLFTAICIIEIHSINLLIDSWIILPHWINGIILMFLFTLVNFLGIKWFGETQYWLVMIKLLFFICIILSGIWVVSTFHHTTAQAISSVNNNHEPFMHTIGFVNHGLSGFIKGLIIVCLSFCGVELASIASGEAENPRMIPKAVNGVIARIIFFYVSGIIVLVLISWTTHTTHNIFLTIFNNTTPSITLHIITIITIVAMFSSLNSFLYGASRVLYRLSLNEHLPSYLSKTNKNQVPKNAIICTTIFIYVFILFNTLYNHQLYPYLVTLSIAGIIINWYIILITHIVFRYKQKKSDIQLGYHLPLAPYTNIIVMALLLFIMFHLAFDPEFTQSIILIPAWFIILFIFYFIYKILYKYITLRHHIKSH